MVSCSLYKVFMRLNSRKQVTPLRTAPLSPLFPLSPPAGPEPSVPSLKFVVVVFVVPSLKHLLFALHGPPGHSGHVTVALGREKLGGQKQGQLRTRQSPGHFTERNP